MSRRKPLFAALLAIGGVLGAGMTPVQAHRLQWSVTNGAPSVVYPAAVVTRPTSVFVWPAYRYMAYHAPTRWDVDGDRIPNHQDRLYNPHWDVDGDGVPNRRDRHDNRYGRGRGR